MRPRPLATSLLALATLAPGPVTVDHSALDAFLKRFVVGDGQVDYLAVREPANLAPLDAYLAAMAKIDPATLSPDERLALYCNLYNAAMIRAVATRYRVGWRASENDYRIFKEPMVRMGGALGVITLDDLEHTLIRKGFTPPDPRIHAAIVCGAVDCPELRPEVYTGPTLQQQLDDRMRRWLNDPGRTRVDEAARVIHPSSLFVYYATDFGGRDKITDYVRKWLPPERADYRIEFKTTYDWTPNIAEPTAGQYVWITLPSAPMTDDAGQPKDALGLGAIVKVLGRDPTRLRVGDGKWVATSATAPYPPRTPAP